MCKFTDSHKIWAPHRAQYSPFLLLSILFSVSICDLFPFLSPLPFAPLCQLDSDFTNEGVDCPGFRKVISVWSDSSVLFSVLLHRVHWDVLTHQRVKALQGWKLQDVTWDLLDTRIRSAVFPPYSAGVCACVCLYFCIISEFSQKHSWVMIKGKLVCFSFVWL